MLCAGDGCSMAVPSRYMPIIGNLAVGAVLEIEKNMFNSKDPPLWIFSIEMGISKTSSLPLIRAIVRQNGGAPEGEKPALSVEVPAVMSMENISNTLPSTPFWIFSLLEWEFINLPNLQVVCRICLTDLADGGEILKLQCSCKGDLAMPHRECAVKWFTVKCKKNCEVCEEDQNLPVILLRLQNIPSAGAVPSSDPQTAASSRWMWTHLPILFVVRLAVYSCLLEILVARNGLLTTVVSLPCSCLLGFLSSFTSAAMAMYLYATVQFGMVVHFVYIFFSLHACLQILPTFCHILLISRPQLTSDKLHDSKKSNQISIQSIISSFNDLS
ncbi:unnamed protein product [Spirodela intermedia]|uniref:RING-CH-type domain-containing protein n=1 Tax=Spirodela intermedia TaxID=51605 RepID=A0A7I8LDC7_SPIIN|nr:unnamed protein product [Spirodela intermedia]